MTSNGSHRTPWSHIRFRFTGSSTMSKRVFYRRWREHSARAPRVQANVRLSGVSLVTAAGADPLLRRNWTRAIGERAYGLAFSGVRVLPAAYWISSPDQR